MVTGMPIRQLSELTGVAAVTLRAWERRYGLLRPARTPKGHRLYSQQDVELVRRVVQLLQQGASISDAARQLQNGVADADNAERPDQWAHLRRRLMRAVETFNETRLEQVYNEALSLYPFDLVTEQLVSPVMTELGSRWASRGTGIGEEHFFSAYLRNKLGARLHHEAMRSQGTRLLVACLPGEYHELGALLFSLGALARGYQVLYLGASYPLEQLEPVADKSHSAAIVLSGTTRALDESLQEEWKGLVPARRPVLFGGRFSAQHADWIEAIGETALGDDQATALNRLQSLVPPYSPR